MIDKHIITTNRSKTGLIPLKCSSISIYKSLKNNIMTFILTEVPQTQDNSGKFEKI